MVPPGVCNLSTLPLGSADVRERQTATGNSIWYGEGCARGKQRTAGARRRELNLMLDTRKGFPGMPLKLGSLSGRESKEGGVLSGVGRACANAWTQERHLRLGDSGQVLPCLGEVVEGKGCR